MSKRTSCLLLFLHNYCWYGFPHLKESLRAYFKLSTVIFLAMFNTRALLQPSPFVMFHNTEISV